MTDHRARIGELEEENAALVGRIENLSIEVKLWRSLENARSQAAQLEEENAELKAKLEGSNGDT